MLEQVVDRKVVWAATEGATNAGWVTFEDVGGGQTSVHLSLEYEPEGLVEKVGDKRNVVDNQAEGDLDRFKAFIEAEGYATGAWRGSVGDCIPVDTPGVAAAASSQGDSGKAGVTGKAVAAGLGLAAATVAGVAAATAAKSDVEDVSPVVHADTKVPASSGPVTTPVDTPPAADPPINQPAHVLTPEEIDTGAAGTQPDQNLASERFMIGQRRREGAARADTAAETTPLIHQVPFLRPARATQPGPAVSTS